MGIYEPIRNFLSFGGSKASDASLLTKILAGMVAGGVAAAVFTPTDLLKVRMQGSSDQRYKNIFHAFKTVIKEERITGLWKGMGPTSQRAAVVAAAELATYDQCKQFLINKNILLDNIFAHFAASVMAGFVATASSSPIGLAYIFHFFLFTLPPRRCGENTNDEPAIRQQRQGALLQLLS